MTEVLILIFYGVLYQRPFGYRSLEKIASRILHTTPEPKKTERNSLTTGVAHCHYMGW